MWPRVGAGCSRGPDPERPGQGPCRDVQTCSCVCTTEGGESFPTDRNGETPPKSTLHVCTGVGCTGSSPSGVREPLWFGTNTRFQGWEWPHPRCPWGAVPMSGPQGHPTGIPHPGCGPQAAPTSTTSGAASLKHLGAAQTVPHSPSPAAGPKALDTTKRANRALGRERRSQRPMQSGTTQTREPAPSSTGEQSWFWDLPAELSTVLSRGPARKPRAGRHLGRWAP